MKKNNPRTIVSFFTTGVIVILFFTYFYSANSRDSSGKATLIEAPKANTESVTMTSYLPEGDASYLIHLIAKDQGYYNDVGLNLIFNTDFVTPKEAVLPGSDLYLMGRSRAYSIEATRPGELVAFNFNTQDSKKWSDSILVRKGLGITSLSQVDPSKIIALVGGGPARVPLMNDLLKEANLDSSLYRLVEIDEKEILSQKQLTGTLSYVDVAYAREPFRSLMVNSGEWEFLIDSPLFADTYFSPWPMSITMFSNNLIQGRPDVAQKIISVYDRTIKYIRDNPKKANEILGNYTKDYYEADGIADTMPDNLVNYGRTEEIDSSLIQKQMDWYYDQGIIARRIDAAEFVYPNFNILNKTKPDPIIKEKVTVNGEDIVRMHTMHKPGKPDLFPLYLGESQGFFKDQNLKLELPTAPYLDTKNPKETIDNYDVIFAGRAPTYLMEIGQPGNLKAVSSTYEDREANTWALITLKDSGYKKLSDLKGHVFGLENSSGKTRWHLSKLILRNNELDPGDFVFRDASVGDLLNRDVDFMYIREPQLALALINPNVTVFMETPLLDYVMDPLPMSFMNLSTRFLEDRPEVAKRFILAWEESIDFMRRNPEAVNEEYYKVMRENYGVDLSGTKVNTMQFWTRSEIQPTLLQEQIDLYHSIGFLPQIINIDDILLPINQYKTLMNSY